MHDIVVVGGSAGVLERGAGGVRKKRVSRPAAHPAGRRSRKNQSPQSDRGAMLRVTARRITGEDGRGAIVLILSEEKTSDRATSH